MPEFSETAVLDHSGEIDIGLGAIVATVTSSAWEVGVCADTTELAITSDIAAKILMRVFFIVSRSNILPTIVGRSDMEENIHY